MGNGYPHCRWIQSGLFLVITRDWRLCTGIRITSVIRTITVTAVIARNYSIMYNRDPFLSAAADPAREWFDICTAAKMSVSSISTRKEVGSIMRMIYCQSLVTDICSFLSCTGEEYVSFIVSSVKIRRPSTAVFVRTQHSCPSLASYDLIKSRQNSQIGVHMGMLLLKSLRCILDNFCSFLN